MIEVFMTFERIYYVKNYLKQERMADDVRANCRSVIKQEIPKKCLPSLVCFTRYDVHNVRKKHSIKLNDKLSRLSEEQEQPLFDVNNSDLR